MMTSKEIKEKNDSLKSNFDVELKHLAEGINQTKSIAEDALGAGRELIDMLKVMRNERDMYKSLRDIESHRLKNATESMRQYEDELGYNEGYCLSPDDSDEKRERKLTAMRKRRCIRYLNQEHGYEID